MTLSEPGGIVGDKGMNIAGAVGYQQGENVVVFLQRMPNGYLRTAGWSQGKFRVDQDGKLHGDASAVGLEVVGANARSATPLRSLERFERVGQLRRARFPLARQEDEIVRRIAVLFTRYRIRGFRVRPGANGHGSSGAHV